MAEIKIEKKKPIWPWILLVLLIIGGLIYFFLYANDDDSIDDDMDDQIEEVVVEDMDDVEDYDLSNVTSIAVLNTYIADPNMGLDHEYSHGALTRLIEATKDVADALDVDINADLASANEMADHIMTEPYDVDHADKIKKAATIITRALKNIQTTHYPALSANITKVEAAVNSIIPGEETLEQKKSIKNFYDQAAAVLTAMK